jgi:hypothetical protein
MPAGWAGILLLQAFMQNGEFARSAQRFIQMLRPQDAGTAAQTAMTRLKPPPPAVGLNPMRLTNFPASLGRLGALEVRLAQQREARPKTALSRVLQGWHGHRRRHDDAGAPRQGCVRQDLRPPKSSMVCVYVALP